MGILIDKEDFVGKYKISTNAFTGAELDAIISHYEIEYIYDLLGVTLGDLFIADLSSQVPQTQIYVDLFDPINFEANRCTWRNSGMKKMMLGFIFWEFTKSQKVKNTISGNVVNQSELSREANFAEANIYAVYNEAVNAYQVIQYYIMENLDSYPDYLGMQKEISHWSI